MRDSLLEIIGQLQASIAQIERAMDDQIGQDPTLRGQRELLVGIDGIAHRSAALLLAELGNVERFSHASAATAFAGLNPRLQRSGKRQGQVCISRTGSARLRAGRFLPALVAMTHNPVVRALKQRLRERGKANKQILCAAMRKLPHIAYGVLESRTPFLPQKALAC